MPHKFQDPQARRIGLAFRIVQKFIVAREPQVCSPLVPRKGNQEHVTTGARTLLRDKAAGQHFLVEKPSTLRLQESVPMGRAWSQGGVQERSYLSPEPSAPKFVDPQDVNFAIKDLLKDRHIGVYQDLAPGGEKFLSRSRVHTPPVKGKQRIVHALCSLNEDTVKRQTTYEDLRMFKSVVRPQDFMMSLDVESVFFHVPIHPKNCKFFSSHLSLPFFVNKFIELQSGGYFVYTRPDLASLVPSAQTPSHLLHHYQMRTLLYVDDLLIS